MNRLGYLLGALIALSSLVGLDVRANELDQDVSNQQRSELSGTVIFRVDNKTKQVAQVEIADVQATTKDEALALATQAKYTPIPQGKLRTELDNETGSSSCYWYWNGGFYPTYQYYGYTYTPYCYVNYGPYSYYWYGYGSYCWW